MPIATLISMAHKLLSGVRRSARKRMAMASAWRGNVHSVSVAWRGNSIKNRGMKSEWHIEKSTA